jgi:hypothetical protein
MDQCTKDMSTALGIREFQNAKSGVYATSSKIPVQNLDYANIVLLKDPSRVLTLQVIRVMQRIYMFPSLMLMLVDYGILCNK